MAMYLYRLGRFSARRAWVVVVAWVLVVGLAGTGAVTLGKPFTSKLSIPGTEFQRILDDLETSLPQAAAGIGTVVIRTQDGSAFTPAQKDAVDAVLTRWEAIDGVDTTVNPFTTQAQLDKAATDVADGKARLADGATQISANETTLAEGQKTLDDGRRELDAQTAKLADARTQLATGQAKLDAGRSDLAAGTAKLAASRSQLDAAAKKAAAGRARLDAVRKQLATGRTELAAAKQQLAAGTQQLAAGQAQLQQLIDTYGEDDARVVQARAQLDAQAAQLAAAEQTVTAKSAELTAGEKKAAAGEAEYAAGQKKLAAGRAELAAGQRTLDAARAKLAAGQAELDANRAKVQAGEAALAKSRADLAAGQADLDKGRAELAAGKEKLTTSQADLQRGERRLALTEGLRTVSATGDVALAQILFTVPINSVSGDTKSAVLAAGSALTQQGLQVDYSKDLAQDIASVIGPGEALGLVIAGIVLLVMLGSLLAAGLPLLTAVIGVAVGVAAAVTLTHWVTMTDVTPALALMLGLAVGIDYALFLVNRHREQLARGVELEESIGRANGTAGNAVLFAGLTVITALAALTLTGIPFLGVMGLVAAGTVAVAVLLSITLTPALLALMGARVLSPRSRRRLAEKLAAEEAEAGAQDAQDAADPHEGRGHGWGGLVTRHPVLTLVASTVVLAVLAVPAASLKLGLPDGGYEPQDSTGYRTYAAIGENFGAGANGPIIAVAKASRGAGMSADQLTDLELEVGARLRATPGVAYVVPIGASSDQRTLAYQVVPTTGPSDDATAALVTTLRSQASDVVGATRIDSLGYTGQTVANIDISKALSDALPIYLAVVVGISLILLLLVFRSVVVPVLATAGFLLSVAAAFGAVVAVYQWGWLRALFGVEHPGLILSFLPTLVIGILFGLAMDYQMFLVSGMREAWAHGHTPRTAVRTGFSHGARVVTAAALIMMAVFGSFMYAHLTMIRPIGFALAIGVLIDAFVVRMTAMPAIMHLVGEKAWYLPSWLRWLPDLDVEGASLTTAREASTAAGTALDDASAGAPTAGAPTAGAPTAGAPTVGAAGAAKEADLIAGN